MKKLTFEEYFPFHIQICQQLANKYQTIAYLKKTTWINNGQEEKPFYELMLGDRTFSHNNGKLEIICNVDVLEEKINTKEIMLYHGFKESTNTQEIPFYFKMGGEIIEEQYKNEVLKNGTIEQITYFVSHALVHSQGLSIPRLNFHQGHEYYMEDLIDKVKHHQHFEEIIKEYLIHQNLKECVPGVQLRVCLFIKKHTSSLSLDEMFDTTFLTGTPQEINLFWKEELKKDYFGSPASNFIKEMIADYAQYLSQRKEGVEIFINFLKLHDINAYEENIQIKIRDAIIEYFDEHIKEFKFFNLLKENDETFIEIDINKTILIQFNYDGLMNKFKLKYMDRGTYPNMMQALIKALNNQKHAGINKAEISSPLHGNNNMTLCIYLENNHNITSKNVTALLNNYYEKFIPSCDLKEMSKIPHENMSNFILKHPIEQWIANYFLSMNLNDNLERKITNIQPKI